MDVGVWLRSLGLGQYEATFQDNEIDGAVLPKLTVDDLKDLGVAVVGHRRKIMSAVEELNAASVARADAMKPPQTQAPPSVGASSGGAERRPITVMFCDLVGSTSLAARLDAEDWGNLVNAYLDEASAAVTDLGGHVLKKLGDGLMALFGYPKAQENDTERAVRAALAIQRSLVDLNARNALSGAPELSARIGLECGSVVVDAAGEVFGEAPNVAARVQAAAEPGTVLVTGSVQRQVAGLFVVEEKGAHELKGVAQPLSLYRVIRASGAGRRGGGKALTQFVGREEELGLLERSPSELNRRRDSRIGSDLLEDCRRAKEAAGMALSDDLRERVVGAVVEGGMSRNAAAKRFGVSIASAVRWVARFKAKGAISPSPTGGDRRSGRIEAHRD